MERVAYVELLAKTPLVEMNVPQHQPPRHQSLDLFLNQFQRRLLHLEHGPDHCILACLLLDHLGNRNRSHRCLSFHNPLFLSHRRCLHRTGQIHLKTPKHSLTMDMVDCFNLPLHYAAGMHWMVP